MAAPGPRKRLREEATCPVCLGYFADPVILDCGHNFCRACIVRCWGESPTEAACPQCRKRVQTSSLQPNQQLANIVEIVKELKLEAAGWETCERHLEPLKLFCQKDKAPICVVCNMSKEHRAHYVVPMEEAVQEYKVQISRSLDILRKKRENILVYKAEKERQDLLKQMEAEREKTAATFRQLRQFLEEQEELLLAQMEELEKEIARRDGHLARLSGDLSSLNSLVQEMEEKQQQSWNELLQNLGNILERCKKELLENHTAFPAALKFRIYDFNDINAFLEGTVKQFKDTLVSGLPLQEANVTLDPDTAHPDLILTEDCKTVKCSDELRCQDELPINPERFDALEVVVGREGFTAGRHSWEVTVGVETDDTWVVGVARKSVQRKGVFEFSPEEGVWILGKWGRAGYSVSEQTGSPRLSFSQEPKRVRVTLNYAGGRVAFFDADTRAQLYVHSGASFGGETLLPFFYVVDDSQLTLCP